MLYMFMIFPCRSRFDRCKKYSIKVVADLHENYPAMLRENTRVPFHRIRNLGNLALKLFFSEKNWRTFEEQIFAMLRCDHLCHRRSQRALDKIPN